MLSLYQAIVWHVYQAPNTVMKNPSDTKTAIASELPRIAGFLIVGGGGFVVHALVIWILTRAGMSSLTAWFPAFLAAVIFTWLLNRVLAFRGLGDKTVKREAAGYFIVQSLGACVNFVVYAAVIWTALGVLSHPIAALAAGSVAAAAFNYGMLRKFIYGAA